LLDGPLFAFLHAAVLNQISVKFGMILTWMIWEVL